MPRRNGRPAPGAEARSGASAANVQFARAVQFHAAGRPVEAEHICRRLRAAVPNNRDLLLLSGTLALETGRDQAAADHFGRALKLARPSAELHASFALACQRLGRHVEALEHYGQALALQPDSLEALYNGANALLALRRYEEAVAWYGRAVAVRPGFADALNNRGVALFSLGRERDALADYDRALAANPRLADAWVNRAAVSAAAGQYDAALADSERALALAPRAASALAQRGSILFEKRRYAEAARDYAAALAIDPKYPQAAGNALYYRMLQCDWTGYEAAAARVRDGIARGKPAAHPFMLLGIVDSPALQQRCAQIYQERELPPAAPLVRPGQRYGHPKVRLAYLSADFGDHPMSHLMIETFEGHDRAQFETTAISFGAHPQSAFKTRVANAFDRWVEMRGAAEREIAAQLRDLEIDVAVDLMGYTSRSKPRIFACRGAPVQVNFLGFPGTLGAGCYDYIIADRFVLPPPDARFYGECVAYLPDTYYPAARRPVAAAPARGDAGLPPDGFVFCCFNQLWKIVPPVFDRWMRLLRQVEGSVLWLLEDDAVAVANLRREAVRRGIAAERLVFAPRVAPDAYLARLGLADLFLDTLPYNAHTSATDALWAGVPVVTCPGAGFAARVAGSVVQAVGLPELVTRNAAEYEALALTLAREPAKLAALRAKLAQTRLTGPLFDVDRFRRDLESAYRIMWERNERGEPPAGFAVGPTPLASTLASG